MIADQLAAALHAAWTAHAEALRGGEPTAIGAAYVAALEAERALLLDCGGPADRAAAAELEVLIADERKGA